MEAPKTLAEAIVAIQAEAPKIALDSTNPHFKSKYPSLAGIMEKILPVTSKHGVAVMQMPTTQSVWEDKGGVTRPSLAPALTTQLVHAASGDKVESTMLLMPAKNDPQGQGSALTYARRYMVLSMLGLVGDEDDDGNASSGDPVEQALDTRTGFASDKQKGFFDRLLKQRGLDSNQAEGIKRFAETLPVERIKAAIDELKESPESADKAVAALLRLSDEWARSQTTLPYDESQ